MTAHQPTYRGVNVPGHLLTHYFDVWKEGVDSALDTSTPQPLPTPIDGYRVFHDPTGDFWYEVSPGKFSCGETLEEARINTLVGSTFTNWTEDDLHNHYGDEIQEA